MYEYQNILQKELEKRRKRNAHYSLRAFAKFLEVSPSTISEVLAGVRGLSSNKAFLIMEKLELSVESKKIFLDSLELSRQLRRKNVRRSAEVVELSPRQFQQIAQWQTYAVLGLLKTQLAKTPLAQLPKRLVKYLRITRDEAQQSLLKLIKLGLVQVEAETITAVAESPHVPEQLSSTVLRKYHGQVLQQARHTLKRESFEECFFGSSALAINPDKYAEAVERLKRLREDLRLLTAKGQPQQVYHLGVQFYPMSKKVEAE